ncbi:MAG TPA: hypothetical protein PKC72_05435 [Chitinophagaceae bacterium]|nr:hypothetical protein [Chitinophagaceae bacterium]
MKRNVIITACIIFIFASLAIAQNANSKSAQSVKKKYVYAMLYYQNEWDRIGGNPREKFVESNNVPQEVSQKVSKSKSVYEALDYLGAEGWELVSTVIRDINTGEEHIHYLKKELN